MSKRAEPSAHPTDQNNSLQVASFVASVISRDYRVPTSYPAQQADIHDAMPLLRIGRNLNPEGATVTDYQPVFAVVEVTGEMGTTLGVVVVVVESDWTSPRFTSALVDAGLGKDEPLATRPMEISSWSLK